MENQEVESGINQHPIKWGAILGLISIIITLFVYIVDITLLAKSAVGITIFVVYLGALIYSGRDYRSKLGGYMSFSKAFGHAFAVLVIAGFIGTVFNYLLFNFIDPDIVPILVEAQMENAMKVMEAFSGASNTEMIDEMAEGIMESYTLKGQATSFLWSLIVYAIGALIVGAINKKRNKEEEF